MDSLELEITTPEKRAFKGQVKEIVAPGADGLFGIRPGHAPLLASILPGVLSFEAEGKTHRFALGGGFIEVADDHVRVLADTADRDRDIDLARARTALADATAQLGALPFGSSEYLHQRARQARARLRIELASELSAER